MIDTLNLFISADNMKNSPFDVLQYLTNVTERQSNYGYSASGTIGDYVISCYTNGVSLKGSLAKYFLPSNLYTLSRQSTREAIEKLSDTIHIDVSNALIRRLDISTIIPTTFKPTDYYCYLGEKKWFRRVNYNKDTLYYSTAKRQIIFYDKCKEAKAKGAIVPPSLIGSNLLRYELRFKQEIARQLKTSTPKAAMLFDAGNYYNLVQQWKNEFFSINKISKIMDIKKGIEITPKQLNDIIFATLLKEKGAEYIQTFYDEAKAKGVFKDPKKYTRGKEQLNKIMQECRASGKSELIEELETAICNIAKYAR